MHGGQGSGFSSVSLKYDCLLSRCMFFLLRAWVAILTVSLLASSQCKLHVP